MQKYTLLGLQGSSQLFPQIKVTVSKFHIKVRFPSSPPANNQLCHVFILCQVFQSGWQSGWPQSPQLPICSQTFSQEQFSLSQGLSMQLIIVVFSLYLLFAIFIPSSLIPFTTCWLKIIYAVIIDVQSSFPYVAQQSSPYISIKFIIYKCYINFPTSVLFHQQDTRLVALYALGFILDSCPLTCCHSEVAFDYTSKWAWYLLEYICLKVPGVSVQKVSYVCMDVAPVNNNNNLMAYGTGRKQVGYLEGRKDSTIVSGTDYPWNM